MRNYKYLLSLVPSVMVIAGNLTGGWWVAANLVFSLGVLAFLENFVKEDKSNLVDESEWFPDFLLFIHVPVQLICLYSLFRYVNQNDPDMTHLTLAALSTGINSGSAAIVVAHELIHRKSRLFRSLGQILLFSAGNIYFYIDHLKVHHKYVGTEKDPATGRYGESLYAFFVRSSFSQIVSSFNVEAKRLKSAGGVKWSISNYVVASLILQLLFVLLLFSLLGWKVAAAYLIQAFFANFLLEYTNYIEHYGLSRKENERVTEVHSWQTDKVISRFFLIDLSRHADHHYYASKPYNKLNSYPTSPVLPAGYVSMIYYALIPPLFFRKMHKTISDLKI